MITNETLCKTEQLILYLTFLLSESIGIAFITSLISSDIVLESSPILFKCAPILEVHELGFQMFLFSFFIFKLHSH